MRCFSIYFNCFTKKSSTICNDYCNNFSISFYKLKQSSHWNRNVIACSAYSFEFSVFCVFHTPCFWSDALQESSTNQIFKLRFTTLEWFVMAVCEQSAKVTSKTLCDVLLFCYLICGYTIIISEYWIMNGTFGVLFLSAGNCRRVLCWILRNS